MGWFLTIFWRASLLALAAFLASISSFLLISKLKQVVVAESISGFAELLIFPVGNFYVAYLLVGFLYYRLFVFLEEKDEEYDGLWERFGLALLIISWPFGLLGEFLGERMIVTSEGAIRRTGSFLFHSVFVRMVLILSLGVAMLWIFNNIEIARTD